MNSEYTAEPIERKRRIRNPKARFRNITLALSLMTLIACSNDGTPTPARAASTATPSTPGPTLQLDATPSEQAATPQGTRKPFPTRSPYEVYCEITTTTGTDYNNCIQRNHTPTPTVTSTPTITPTPFDIAGVLAQVN